MNAGDLGRCLLALAATVSSHAQADDRPLRHDPFTRPALALLSAGNARGADAVAEALPPPPPWSPHLTAVMIAGRESLAVVDGEIVRLGEEIDGHRLVQVRDREAVFQKGSKRSVVEIRTTLSKPGKERGGR